MMIKNKDLEETFVFQSVGDFFPRILPDKVSLLDTEAENCCPHFLLMVNLSHTNSQLKAYLLKHNSVWCFKED